MSNLLQVMIERNAMTIAIPACIQTRTYKVGTNVRNLYCIHS